MMYWACIPVRPSAAAGSVFKTGATGVCGQLRSFLGRYALPSVSEFCSTVTSTRFQSTTVFPKPRSDIFGSDNVVSSPLPDIQMPTEDIFSFIMKEFPNYGSKIGLVDGLSGREYSYNEIAEITRKFSSGLQNRLGFEKGDVLGIVAPNSPEYAVLYLGTLAAGGVVSTCNPAYTADELAYQFKNSSTKIIATIPAILPTIQEAAEKSGVEKIIVLDESKQNSSTGNLISYSSLVADSGSLLDPVRTEPDDVMVLPYSSGTTGLPKGVMLTNRSISSNVLQKIHPELMSLKADDSRLLGILPFFHIYGMVSTLLSSLHAGTRLITLPKFEPETFLSTIEKHRITFAHIVPPLVVFLAKHPLVEKYNVTSIEDLITAAAPLGGDVLKSASERTRCKLIRQAYGLTEASPITHMMAKSLGMSSPASIGACIRSMKVKIVDPESGEVLPANKEGEMWIYGPNVMKGYLNNPEATQKSITHDGWFKSGDIGYYDENGLFFITDRLKELIKVKGFQVAPAELEALLLTHPKIVDVAVIGVPNERLGEAPKAFVVKKEGSLSEKDVQEFIAKKLSEHKHLVGGVVFLDTIPKSASGKILRRTLK